MGTFAVDVAKWVEQAKDKGDQVVRAVALEMLSRVALRSPVGNPELWAANAVAAQYNHEVSIENARLRDDPANLDKRGRLKRGRKINDSMRVNAPPGYVGGRFRGNWQVSISVAARGVIKRIDATGGETIATEGAKLDGFKAGPSIFITNNLPYGPRLEYEGWSKQAPNGMVRITAAEFQNIVVEAVGNLK